MCNPFQYNMGINDQTVASKLDPFFLALSRARRRRFDDCVEICSDILEQNPYDQVGIFLNLKFYRTRRRCGIQSVKH